jgi:phosphatidylserine decarboxylase
MPRSTATAVIQYRDRGTGRLEPERVFHGEALAFLYENRVGRVLASLLTANGFFSRGYGWLQRRPASRRKIPRFISGLGVDAGEAERPPGEYASLDEFFTRRLKPGSRPIEHDPERLVTPADGRIRVFPRLRNPTLEVKGSRVHLEDLLGDRALADRYADGALVVIRLAAADYHRFHFPDSGIASEPRAVGRRLHSVHPIALGAGAPSFENKRMLTRIDTRGFGPMLQIEIGALTVGTIEQTFQPGVVERGQEKGLFRFGGSAMVLLAEPGRLRFDEDLVRDSEAGIETLVRMGQPIAKRLSSRR